MFPFLLDFEALPQLLDLFRTQRSTSLFEEFVFLFLDVVLDVLLKHLCLGLPLFVGCPGPAQFPQQRLHLFMLFVSFKNQITRFGLVLQRGIEDLFFDVRVQIELFLDLLEDA